MGLEARGKLHIIHDAQQVTERFRKREFVLELADNERYPQFVLFQLTGDRCDNLEGLEVGDDVNVEFSLRGREWTSPKGDVKYFNSLDVWTLTRAGAGASGRDRNSDMRDERGKSAPAHFQRNEPPLPDGPPPGPEDDIPF